MATPPALTTSPPFGVPWRALARLIRLHNQTGTSLLLLPTLWALVLAERGLPSLYLTAIFVAGSFVMRSAGVILNDLADRSFDREVARTRTRPLASGELSVRQAAALLLLLLTAAAGLVLLLDPLVLRLAPVALALAAFYPFSKRWLHIPQAMLGVAFGWGAVMAWAAARGRLETPAWLLFGATVAWAVAYDTIYGLQDCDDDRRIGVKSAALLFGSSTWLAVGIALAVMLLFLGAAGRLSDIGWPYYVALSGTALFFAAQSLRLRRPVDPSHAFAMFRAHVWCGVAVLAGLLAGFLLA
ncbi:4-hydroxybenzoate octaprenyltransferase [Nitrospira moscoviensis]|uniref:4-hydroxybenzoate octaprenyltransferase n=1 Tax=Nitrospira moscoviensis TaxID=42253 RepID=A0A0K2G893_NITMO|nr:4-hydroxybenzoate octaprenyltransferase [Nitrospira moscoviensis]ALA57178.1 4-hydroxybenzoate octaprenyltransferase [Nitrospira moscoviensis]